jgi:hypothetical protein
MVAIQIHDEKLAKQLQDIATKEQRPIEAILQTLLDQYSTRMAALDNMRGIFDDDVTDLSASVRQTMTTFYQKHDERSD